METSTYRRQASKTLAPRTVKAGLRYVTRNTARTNLFQAAIGLATEVGDLGHALKPYILGEGKYTPEMQKLALDEMGDVGFWLVMAAKFTKAKVPGSGKKLKLVGTRGNALLDLQGVVIGHGGILSLARHAAFAAPHMKTEHVPAAEGKPAADKQVIDKEKQAKADAHVIAQIKAKVEVAIDLFFRLSLDMFGTPPAQVFATNFAKLEHKYGKALFVEAPKPAPTAPAAKSAAPAAKASTPAKAAA